MGYKARTGLFLFATLFISIVAFAQVKSNESINQLKTEKMKEYILLIRLPLGYGAEQASVVRAEWTTLTDQWKVDSIFVTSFVFPAQGYVISSDGTVVNEEVLSNGLRVISSIVLSAPNFDEALRLAKKCPVLKQGGTVEVREVQPRT